jgi:transketolase
MGNIGDKFRSFGWFVQDVNGHDTGEILDAVIARRRTRAALRHHPRYDQGLRDVCGGVEGNHHMSLTKEQMEEAIRKVSERLEEASAAVSPEWHVDEKSTATAAEEEPAPASEEREDNGNV